MTVTLTEEVFARLIGKRGDRDVLLFEMSPGLLADMLERDDWSPLIQVRAVRSESGLVELHLRKVGQ